MRCGSRSTQISNVKRVDCDMGKEKNGICLVPGIDCVVPGGQG